MNRPVPRRAIPALLAGMLIVSGCMTVSPLRVTNYVIAPPETDAVERVPLNVMIATVDGRKPYMRQRMSVSPSARVLDAYDSAQWAYSPAEMLGEVLLTGLARRFTFVTPAPCVVPGMDVYTVRVYIDTFDHVRRGRSWMAHTRLKYEIVDRDGQVVQPSTWFDNETPLRSSSLDAYVDAQSEAISTFTDIVSAQLKIAAGVAGSER